MPKKQVSGYNWVIASVRNPTCKTLRCPKSKPAAAGAAIRYTLRKAREVGGIWKLWKAMRTEKRLQDLRAGHGRADGRHGQRSGALSRSLQEVAAGDGRRHAGGDPAATSGSTYSLAAAAGILAARAGNVRPARRSRCCYDARRAVLPADHVGRRLRPHRRQAASASRPTRPSGTSAAAARNEAGFLLQLFARLYGTNNVNNCSYYCHQASGVGLDSVARHAARRPLTLEDVEHADLRVRHRRQPGEQSSAADDDADARPPARRRSDRDQPGRRNGAGELQRAQRPVEPAVRHEDRHRCTCSRTSAATWRC